MRKAVSDDTGVTGIDPVTKRLKSVHMDYDGALNVTSNAVGLSRETLAVEPYPLIHTYTPYGIIHNQLWDQFTAFGGTIVATSDELMCSISSTTYSYALIRSKKVLKLRPGMDIAVNMSAKFGSFSVDQLQFVGVGSATSDFYFCTNPDTRTFAVRQSTGGSVSIVTIVVTSGFSTASTTLDLTLGGITENYTLFGLTGLPHSTTYTAHEIEDSFRNYGGLSLTWNCEHIGSTLIFSRKSVGALSGSNTIVGNGTFASTLTVTNTGSALSTTYVDLPDMSGSQELKASFDPTTIQTYQILYSWPGDVYFKVKSSENSQFETLHKMQFLGGTANSLSTPNMYIQRGLASLGGTGVSKTLSLYGVYGAYLGTPNITLPKYGISVEKTALTAATQDVMLVIQNRLVIGTYTNTSEIKLTYLSIYVDGTKPVTLSITLNPTSLGAGTTTDFSNYTLLNSTYSIAKYDTTVKTITGGTTIQKFTLPKSGSFNLDLQPFDITLNREDTIVFHIYSTATTDCSLSVGIIEDL